MRAWTVRLLKRLRQAARDDKTLVIFLLLIAGGVWAFVELADEVHEGDAKAFDETVLLWFRSADDAREMLGPEWLDEAVRDFTAMGSFAVIAFVAAAAFGYLLLARQRHTAYFLAAAVVSGTAVSSIMKVLFGRPRPDLVPHATAVFTASFPSGHSFMSALVYLTLAVLLARTHTDLWIRIYLVAVSVALTVLVGMSRIITGVHWPTDVLAGWTAGAVWALFCRQVAALLANTGYLEPPE